VQTVYAANKPVGILPQIVNTGKQQFLHFDEDGVLLVV
jgi:hypothetical protein